ncbi:MAG: sigma-70 family RNA polymerase sigma factor [Pseudomonadota bacterium]
MSKTAKPKLRLVKSSPAVKKISATKKRAARHLKAVVLEAKIAESLTPFQQEALIMKYRLKARKLGRSMLRRWHARLDLDEVDSVVDLSLCEAVKRFDASKGASFMTFLFYHMKGNMVRSVAASAAANAIPLALAEAGESRLADCEVKLYGKFSGINANEIADAITSQDEPLPDEALWRKELTERSALACDKLDSLEREIVKRLFVHEQQIIDIAAALGYSRCHISRVKRKALVTLQDELRTVMNREDYAAIKLEMAENNDLIDLEVKPRKEVARRKPRSATSRRIAEEREAKAA